MATAIPKNYQLGSARISSEQKGYLLRARDSRDVPEIGQILYRIITDGEIASGEEQLLPEWIEVFEKQKSILAERLPQGIFDEIRNVFENLQQIDAAAAKLAFPDVNAAFLLGAGASKPAPSNIPTVMELLPELLTRARRLDRDDLNRLADFCEMRNISNIEDLLTAAHLATFTSRNPATQRLVNFLLSGSEPGERPTDRAPRFGDQAAVAFLQDTLQVLFGLLASTMLPAKPNAAHKAIATYAKKRAGTNIITTNYDCCMDLALDATNYPFSYALEFGDSSSHDSSAPNDTRLIKLHGSLNWFYCETCQKVQRTNIKKTVKNFMNDLDPYPVIAICKDCGGQRRGLLVPPLAMKFDVAPPLISLTAGAGDAFVKTDVIVVVGFSFADADLHITRMLSKSMQNDNSQQVVIVDPGYAVTEKLRRKLKAIIPNFDPTRVIRVSGDCADVLPKLLTGELRKAAEKKAKPAIRESSAKIKSVRSRKARTRR
jgi:NAD-dependent SIR2 family protein deacetylase